MTDVGLGGAGHADLHLIKLAVDVPALMAFGRSRRLPMHDVDYGYLLHCVLDELFGSGTLRPFWFRTAHGRSWSILAYASRSAFELHAESQRTAEPEVWQVVSWRQFVSKQMPVEWPTGTRLAFRARVCPVQRMGHDGDYYKRGSEVDVFLARAWDAGPEAAVDRAAEYETWFARQVERHGGAQVHSVRMEAFRRTRLLRRGHGPGRTAALCERPDAELVGELETLDSGEFSALLAHGVGRHRAFGFGMLRLSRAQSNPLS